MRTVSILCASRASSYHDIGGIEVYDADRDAMTFKGDTPIVAHPPCRAWSAFCRHQAKPEPGEKELGLWCCEQLKACGGVLEQPAFSHLFAAGGLPTRGETIGDLSTLEILQCWWGYPMLKKTWLCFSGVEHGCFVFPPKTTPPADSRRVFQVMSKNQRAATCRPLAEWLIDAARKSTVLPS